MLLTWLATLGPLPATQQPRTVPQERHPQHLLTRLRGRALQVLPPHINGGCYQCWSDSYEGEEVGGTRV